METIKTVGAAELVAASVNYAVANELAGFRATLTGSAAVILAAFPAEGKGKAVPTALADLRDAFLAATVGKTDVPAISRSGAFARVSDVKDMVALLRARYGEPDAAGAHSFWGPFYSSPNVSDVMAHIHGTMRQEYNIDSQADFRRYIRTDAEQKVENKLAKAARVELAKQDAGVKAELAAEKVERAEQAKAKRGKTAVDWADSAPADKLEALVAHIFAKRIGELSDLASLSAMLVAEVERRAAEVAKLASPEPGAGSQPAKIAV